jgi:hypothetical protein
MAGTSFAAILTGLPFHENLNHFVAPVPASGAMVK